MSGKQKTRFNMPFLFCLLIAAFFVFTAKSSHALEADSSFQGLINSAKQIGGSLTEKASGVNLESVNPSDWLDKADEWFRETTGGTGLREALKFIGGLFISILSLALDLLKWLVSLI